MKVLVTLCCAAACLLAHGEIKFSPLNVRSTELVTGVTHPEFRTATNQLWNAVGGKVSTNDFKTATNDLWGAIGSIVEEVPDVAKSAAYPFKPKRLGDMLYEINPNNNFESLSYSYIHPYSSDVVCYGASGFCTDRYHAVNVNAPFDSRSSFIVRSPSGLYSADGENWDVNGFVGMSLIRLDTDFIESATFTNLYVLIGYCLSDGMNDKGVVIHMGAIPKNEDLSEAWRGNESGVVFYAAICECLEGASTAEDAAGYLADNIYVPSSTPYDVHFLVSDRTSSYVVEDGVCYIENEGKPVDVLSDFRIGGDVIFDGHEIDMSSLADYDQFGKGVERYNIISSSGKYTEEHIVSCMINTWFSRAYNITTSPYWLSEHTEIGTEKNLWKVINSPEYFNQEKTAWSLAYDEDHDPSISYRQGATYISSHSSIYDKNNLTLRLFSQEKSESVRVFSLKCGGEISYITATNLFPLAKHPNQTVQGQLGVLLNMSSGGIMMPSVYGVSYAGRARSAMYVDQVEELSVGNASTGVSKKMGFLNYNNDNLTIVVTNAGTGVNVGHQVAFRDDKVPMSRIYESESGTNPVYHVGQGLQMLELPGQIITIGDDNIPAESIASNGCENIIVVGASNSSTGQNTIAIGYGNYIYGEDNIAFGLDNVVYGNSNMSFGNGAYIGDDDDIEWSIALSGYAYGSYALSLLGEAVDDGDIALGSGSFASNTFSTAIGVESSAIGQQGISIGASAKSSEFGSIALGMLSGSYGVWNVALGPDTLVTNGVNGVAIGEQATVKNSHYGVALGCWSSVESPYGIAIRGSVKPNSEAGIAIGDRARAKHPHAVVISGRNQNSTPSGYYDSHGTNTVNIDVKSLDDLYFGEMTAREFLSIIPRSEITNIVRAIANSYWDQQLGVTWTSSMENGSLKYYATTNVNTNTEN